MNLNLNPNLLYHHHHVYFNCRTPRMVNQRASNDWCVSAGRGVSALMRRKSSPSSSIAARDRVIDFGKYKGKMLGSVPSGYLKWVSKNLRAGDFEEWAKLADQVLRDPIYRDRIEWEFALNLLNGNSSSSSSSLRRPTSESAVSELLEISERFGWDNLDKIGWAKVDFDLLGTSKGGRIPRLANVNCKDPPPTSLTLPVSPQPEKTRRMERRERQKMMRLRTETEAKAHRHKHMVMAEPDDTFDGSIGKQDDRVHILNQNAILNPFPGRQSLLQKVINHSLTR